MNTLSKRKKKEEHKKFLTGKACNFIMMTVIFALVIMIVPVFADGDTSLDSAKNLLSSAATAGGTLWAVWGLVQLGMAIKDHNGPGMQGAIWQIVGGAVIIAAATLIKGVNLNMEDAATSGSESGYNYTITEDSSRLL